MSRSSIPLISRSPKCQFSKKAFLALALLAMSLVHVTNPHKSKVLFSFGTCQYESPTSCQWDSQILDFWFAEMASFRKISKNPGLLPHVSSRWMVLLHFIISRLATPNDTNPLLTWNPGNQNTDGFLDLRHMSQRMDGCDLFRILGLSPWSVPTFVNKTSDIPNYEMLKFWWCLDLLPRVLFDGWSRWF